MIFRRMVDGLSLFGSRALWVLTAYRLLVGPTLPRTWRGLHIAVVLPLMLTGYFFIYVTTPLPLQMHIYYSLERLYVQLWPTALVLFFLRMAAPGKLKFCPRWADKTITADYPVPRHQSYEWRAGSVSDRCGF